MTDHEREHEDERASAGLAGALVALREEMSGRDASAAAETRRRVLLAAAGQRRRKLLVLRVVVPLAAVIAIGTAWAASGRRLPGQEPRPLDPRAVEATPQAATGSAPSTASPAASVGPAPVPAPIALDAVADASADLPIAPAPAPATRLPTAPDREDALYRTAHEAHFLAHDPARALAAWDAYLAAFPQGRLAPEARYNRALVLVRLGRKDEARAALTPFADAPPGSYRQAEARSLLDALRGGMDKP